MKIKCFLPCYTDYQRLEYVLENFTKHNKDIDIFLSIDGSANPFQAIQKFSIKKYKIHDNKVWYSYDHGDSSEMVMGYENVKRLFEYALNEEDYDYILYLETDVLCKASITKKPSYDLSGVLNLSNSKNNSMIYKIYELEKYNNLIKTNNNQMWYHTGCGGTIFSKNYFLKSAPYLDKIKQVSEEYPFLAHCDMSFTVLSIISGCTYGAWEEVSQRNCPFPYNPNSALEHNIKI